MDNFSYMQAWQLPNRGFINFVTRYKDPSDRTLFFITSPDGTKWSEWTRLAAIEKGHYQISTCSAQKAVTAFNYHPNPKGLNWRTDLYYLETPDFGHTWQNAAGKKVNVPLTTPDNNALVHDYAAEGLKVYLKTFASIPMAILSFSSSPAKDTNPVLKMTLVLGHFYNGPAMIGTSVPSPLPTATTTWDRCISKLMVPIALSHLPKLVLRHITLVAKWSCGRATTTRFCHPSSASSMTSFP